MRNGLIDWVISLHGRGPLKRAAPVVVISLLAAAAAVAHPMGNFTISQYTSIRLDPDAAVVRYRVDMAELPTADEMGGLDTDGDGKVSPAEKKIYLAHKVAELTQGQSLRLNNLNVAMTVVGSDLQVQRGDGGLPTLLITIDYKVVLHLAAGENRLSYSTDNFSGRKGWREIIATAGAGCRIVRASVPDHDASHELTSYPREESAATPQDSAAWVTFAPGSSAPGSNGNVASVAAKPQAATPRVRDRFAELIAAPDLSKGVLLVSLCVALVLGAFHALSPGHGKTLVAAYLIGSRSTPWHAVLLGVVVTVTHTISVFALGLAALLSSSYVLPETLYPWLAMGSGAVIIAMGSWQFTRKLARLSVGGGHTDSHDHGPGGHTHNPQLLATGGLVALGITGGIIPCPSALVVLLSAIALHRVGLGLVLILAFSVGLAAVLTAVGIVSLYAKKMSSRISIAERWSSRIPLVSSAVITLLGLVIVVRAWPTMGISFW